MGFFNLKVLDNDLNEVGPNEEGMVGIKVKPNRPMGLFSRYVDDEKKTSDAFQGDYFLTGKLL